jgi:hypothetical protein
MTSEDLRSQLYRLPFQPLRLHLVSGNSFDIASPDNVTMLQNTVMIVEPVTQRFDEPGYDVIALCNIERIEQIRAEQK